MVQFATIQYFRVELILSHFCYLARVARVVKALTKQEGPNVCWNAPKMPVLFLNLNQLFPAKKDSYCWSISTNILAFLYLSRFNFPEVL